MIYDWIDSTFHQPTGIESHVPVFDVKRQTPIEQIRTVPPDSKHDANRASDPIFTLRVHRLQVCEQRRQAEPILAAVRTAVNLELLRRTMLKLLHEIILRRNGLQRVIRGVRFAECSPLLTTFAQVVIMAAEAGVPDSGEVPNATYVAVDALNG